MSFENAAKGARPRQRGGGGGGAGAGSGETESMRVQIQGNLERMNNLLTEMKQCNARIGKKKDTDQSRKQLQDAQEQSQNLREETMHLFKQFRAAGGSKAQQDKLIRDFQSINKKVVEVTKATAELMGKNPEPAGGGAGGIDAGAIDDSAETSLLAADAAAQQQQLRLQNNEDQIMQRDRAIQDIESTVADVAEIMQDLAVVVHTQDGLIDNIEQAVEQTVEDTKAAGQELTKAEGYQKKSRKVILCLFPILVITLGVVILIVWHPWKKH